MGAWTVRDTASVGKVHYLARAKQRAARRVTEAPGEAPSRSLLLLLPLPAPEAEEIKTPPRNLLPCDRLLCRRRREREDERKREKKHETRVKRGSLT